jgi:hypothetical protein
MCYKSNLYFRIQKREVLEEANDLEPRVSVLGELVVFDLMLFKG